MFRPAHTHTLFLLLLLPLVRIYINYIRVKVKDRNRGGFLSPISQQPGKRAETNLCMKKKKNKRGNFFFSYALETTGREQQHIREDYAVVFFFPKKINEIMGQMGGKPFTQVFTFRR